MQKTKEQLGEEFWQRIEFLIGEERPYSWCARVGINKGSFQSAYNRRSRPLDQTIDKWSHKTGVDAGWLKTGLGTPYPDEGRIVQPSDGTEYDHLPGSLAKGLKQEQTRQSARTADQVIQEGVEMRLGFHPDYIADALDIIDEVVEIADVRIDNQTKANLIIQLCSLMNTTDDMDNIKRSISSVLQVLKTG